MLDRETVKDFLLEELEDIEIPEEISIENLTEAFCQYTENDYYEWLSDNFSSFFSTFGNGIEWDDVQNKINKHTANTTQ